MLQPLGLGFGALVTVAVLIFNLNADHRASVFYHHALGLFCKLGPIAPHMVQVLGIVFSQAEPALDKPVGKAAIAALAVVPRANSQPHRHLKPPANLQEAP